VRASSRRRISNDAPPVAGDFAHFFLPPPETGRSRIGFIQELSRWVIAPAHVRASPSLLSESNAGMAQAQRVGPESVEESGRRIADVSAAGQYWVARPVLTFHDMLFNLRLLSVFAGSPIFELLGDTHDAWSKLTHCPGPMNE
jgi:hypothetical protein